MATNEQLDRIERKVDEGVARVERKIEVVANYQQELSERQHDTTVEVAVLSARLNDAKDSNRQTMRLLALLLAAGLSGGMGGQAADAIKGLVSEGEGAVPSNIVGAHDRRTHLEVARHRAGDNLPQRWQTLDQEQALPGGGGGLADMGAGEPSGGDSPAPTRHRR